VETPKGSFWEIEGKLRGAAASGSSNSRLLKILSDRGFATPDGSLPPAEPKLMLEYMDQCGMWAAVTFGGLAWKGARDAELLKAIYAAYNDYALEVRAAAPDRLIMLPNVTARFPEEVPTQIESLAKQGVKAVELPYWDAGEPLYEDVWEPTWAVAEEAGIRICSHLGVIGGAEAIPAPRRGANLAWAAAQPLQAGLPLGQLIFSGVFERHPALKFCFAETRVGWAPFFVDWMDRQVRVDRANDPRAVGASRLDGDTPLSLPPGEYFKRNVVLTFEDDTVGLELLGSSSPVLVDSALWGGDYPHPQGVWGSDLPKRLADHFAGVDEATRRWVVMDHAAAFFEIPLPPGGGGRSSV
jgi:predicted TIM-barrel fold metal-dependent hydrolase